MEWLYSLFIEHSALQAVVVLSLISAIGLGLGKIHVCGISLGVTFVSLRCIFFFSLKNTFFNKNVSCSFSWLSTV